MRLLYKKNNEVNRIHHQNLFSFFYFENTKELILNSGAQLDDNGLKAIRLNSHNNFNTIKNVKFDIRK